MVTHSLLSPMKRHVVLSIQGREMSILWTKWRQLVGDNHIKEDHFRGYGEDYDFEIKESNMLEEAS